MEIFFAIFITILGAIMGSFLGCMGYRIPNKIKITYPSSYCASCGKSLKWYMNIPIISYIFLKGRCAYCKDQFGFIYFFCEIAGAILFLCNYLMFDFSMMFFTSTVITCILIVTMVSDFLYYYISDRVLIISSILLLIINHVFLSSHDFLLQIVYALIIFIVMLLIKLGGNIVFKKESLGDGDIKLMGVIALGVGLTNSFVTLFFASITGLIYSFATLKKNNEGIIPFGPFIIIGALMTIYLSDIIMPIINEYIII